MEDRLEDWDIFISHASEDKEDFVQPLADALAAFGVRVWYDKFTLKIGDSLSRSIDRGLSKSNYGLIVLSPSFISKSWPEYELRGLTARELSGDKIILPIWHNVSHRDILNFSPPLADKLAVDSKSLTPLQIAIEVIKVIRPDIFTRILRRIAYYQRLEGAEVRQIALKDIKPSPIQHPTLPPEMIGRIRLIRATLLDVYGCTMEFWIDGFRRDAHPSGEIAYWEHVSAVYCEYINMHPEISTENRSDVFGIILSIGNSSDEEHLKSRAKNLPKGSIDDLRSLWASAIPLFEFESDSSVFKDQIVDADIIPERLGDKEHFPNDLPEALIREIIEATK
ncbi:toll/interleukin-1 receptor domain-containing protein [Rhizobium sp. 10PS4]|uniref:toll/interleukin-1 receptor domain-containing protein n=1 Tax=Rhizobium sp. 10PS4 TaxID=3075621 RepID=UPI0028FD4F22|nr:toll/interleukin-1 receptor domain-containing protein [Rhizobium sp. 10PS4]MDU0307252.1 toll/interleukin-1 receptor domain-containing protein [Rhizobium sp. 10PS4]